METEKVIPLGMIVFSIIVIVIGILRIRFE